MNTIDQVDCSFEDWDAFDPANGQGVLGYPQLAPLDDGRVLVSTWHSRCYALDLVAKTSEPCPLVNAAWPLSGTCLTAPSVARCESGTVCAVAMRTGWASFWHLGDEVAVSIHPEMHGPVSAVALHPEGHLMAMGLGYYSLTPGMVPKAHVELWELGSPPQYLNSCCVPGVAIDHLAWSPEGDRILAVSGDMQQQSGHVTVLDRDSLSAIDMSPLEFAMSSSVMFCCNAQALLVAARDRIEIRHADDASAIQMRVSIEAIRSPGGAPFGEIYQAGTWPEREHMVLNNGLLVDVTEGKTVAIPVPPRCIGIAAMPNGDCVGITSDGVVRVWDQPLNAVRSAS